MYPIKPISVNFGSEGDKELEKFVFEKLSANKDSCQVLHEQKVKNWRRLLRGEPKNPKKDFPWPNASNLVVQVIGTCQDIMKARIMGNIWELMPIFPVSLTGEWDEAEQGDEQRAALEEAMNLFATEPDELDLFRVESLWFGEAIGFGTSFLKAPFEHLEEIQVVSLDGSYSEENDKSYIRKHGPSPEKIPFENFIFDTKASTLSSCDFKAHRIPLSKQDLEERAYHKVYDPEIVKEILKSPDEPQTSGSVQQERKAQEGIHESIIPANATWNIYECWFPYFRNGKKYRLVYTYHLKTRKTLRKIFNFYPDNEECFRMARLGYDDDGLLGYGFAEMLEHYQEEISTGHNQRVDNRTLLNTSIARVSRASKLDSIFSLYPGAIVPGEKDEIEIMNLGTSAESSVPEEQLTLQLAERRAGIDMAIQGSGSGTQNPRKGIYSAMGTFSVMQQSNRRSNLRTTDMRYAHVSLGRLLLKLYATFGLGDKAKIFGKNAPLLQKALENSIKGRVSFPIRAATASVNRELEKQNDMLLVNVLRQHHMGVAQILQGVSSGQLPPDMQKYLMDTIISANALMHDLLRGFGKDDTSRLLPEPEIVKKEKAATAARGAIQNATSGRESTETSTAGDNGNIIPTTNEAQAGTQSSISASGVPGISNLPNPNASNVQ